MKPFKIRASFDLGQTYICTNGDNFFVIVGSVCNFAVIHSAALWEIKGLDQSLLTSMNMQSEDGTMMMHGTSESIFHMVQFLPSMTSHSSVVLSLHGFQNSKIVQSILYYQAACLLPRADSCCNDFANSCWWCPSRMSWSLKSWITVTIHSPTITTE